MKESRDWLADSRLFTRIFVPFASGPRPWSDTALNCCLNCAIWYCTRPELHRACSSCTMEAFISCSALEFTSILIDRWYQWSAGKTREVYAFPKLPNLYTCPISMNLLDNCKGLYASLTTEVFRSTVPFARVCLIQVCTVMTFWRAQ